MQLLCCSFQQYLHCSERIVNSTCGYETARFTKSFLDRMSGPLIQVSLCGDGMERQRAESNQSYIQIIVTVIVLKISWAKKLKKRHKTQK